MSLTDALSAGAGRNRSPAPDSTPASPGRWKLEPAAWWWLAGFVVAAGAGVSLSFHVASGKYINTIRWHLFAELAWWFGAWVAAVVCALHLPRRVALVAILLAAILLRIGALDGPPRLSTDANRYSWDARVQLAGIDPYRYPPVAEQLIGLRESVSFPNAARCAELKHAPGCTIINHPKDRTIYPPVAEAWFTAVYWLAGGIHSGNKVWQATGFATELGTMALILLLLYQRRRDPRWVALYALSPIPVLEAVNNGHVDGLAVLLVLAALFVLGVPSPGLESSPGPWWTPGRRAVAAGVLVGAATLVKLYPAAALLPIVSAPWLRWRHRIGAAAALVVTVVIGYVPHVLAVGPKVLGYLPGYLRAESYTGTGNRFLLVDLLHLHSTHEIDAVVAAVVLVAAAVIFFTRPDPLVAGAAIFGVLLLVANPVQPWYSMVLLGLAAAAPRPRWALVPAAAYPYFFAVILGAKHRPGIGQWSYGVALGGVVVAAWWRRARPDSTSSYISKYRAARPSSENRSARSWPEMIRRRRCSSSESTRRKASARAVASPGGNISASRSGRTTLR